MTTPNVEYNVRFEALAGALRHPDHRFEWTRAEFARLGDRRRRRYGYRAFRPVGPEDPEVGPPTQMAVFTRASMTSTSPSSSWSCSSGVSGSGKSTFARKHFRPTEVISSDFCRGLVADDENDQAATPDAFDVLHFIAGKRLAAGRLTVIDATNVQPRGARAAGRAGRGSTTCCRSRSCSTCPRRVCPERNARGRTATSAARHPPPAVAAAPLAARPQREGFRPCTCSTRGGDRRGQIERAAAVQRPAPHETGPFDIIGDVHGCCAELVALLPKLG